MPVESVTQRCRDAEKDIADFLAGVGTWFAPVCVPEKVQDLTDRFDKMKPAFDEVVEYIDHVKKINDKVMKARAAIEKNWRSLKTSYATTIHNRLVPNALARVAGFA